VVGIFDGDTVTLLTEQRVQYRIRHSDIATIERRQSYGDRARQALSDLAFGKAILITVRDHDRYGRVVRQVYAEGRDVSVELVRQAAAWVYRRYSNNSGPLLLEVQARQGSGAYGACRRPSACRGGMASGPPGIRSGGGAGEGRGHRADVRTLAGIPAES
jgi:endonuclease YncB( thermonuclease family)